MDIASWSIAAYRFALGVHDALASLVDLNGLVNPGGRFLRQLSL